MLSARHALLWAKEEFRAVPPLALQALLKRVSFDEIPISADLLSGRDLEERMSALNEPAPSVIVVGDIMLGGRAKKAVSEFGPVSPIECVMPLLMQAPIVLHTLDRT